MFASTQRRRLKSKVSRQCVRVECDFLLTGEEKESKVVELESKLSENLNFIEFE